MARKNFYLPPDVIQEGLTYDKAGRFNYHPFYHHNHRTPFSTDELIYLCKYYEFESVLNLSFALGRTEKTIKTKIGILRQSGLYDIYKNMTDEEWEIHSQAS